MSDLMRMTGMYSGMDTEAVIQSLVSAKAKKVTDLKNDQKKLEWKQNIWQDLNSKIYNLYSKTLSNLRLTGGYNKKSTTVSDPTKATVVANGNAADGTQTLKVNELAKAKYITGGKVEAELGSNLKLKSDNTLGAIDHNLVGSTINVTTGTGDEAKTTAINITSDMKISDFVAKLNDAGVNASFDEDNQRFFISSKKTGVENKFELEVTGYAGGTSEQALGELGLTGDAGAVIVDAKDAEIELNGAKFTSSTNSITVNGLTVEALATTEGEITINTKTDYQGIYDTIKDFISEYNDIVNEVYSRYNPDSSKKYWKYDMLTDEEKEAMSDEEIEAWEDNIKEGLLRKDTNLSKVLNCLTGSITKGFETSSGTKYLFDFGIGTLNYFEAADGERKSLHINGDADDENTADKEDKLMKALTTDTEGTIEFFAAFCKDMYDKLNDTMQATDYRSIYKVYDDKRLKSEYDDYTKKIKEAEDKLSAYEDKWYKKFSDMEVALSKLQSQQNTISSMLGM